MLDGGADLAGFKPPPAARAGWAALAALMHQLRDAAAWPADLALAIAWYQTHLERLYDDARVRRGDLDTLLRLSNGHGSRSRFVTELTLDPPAATGDEAGPPHRDDDYLVLSTLHSAKGQEWSAVHLLRMVDGCMPADMATGRATEIEEERRLLYVGMTRAKDSLTLWMPQRFHVTQQHAWGDRHLLRAAHALHRRRVAGALRPGRADGTARRCRCGRRSWRNRAEPGRPAGRHLGRRQP